MVWLQGSGRGQARFLPEQLRLPYHPPLPRDLLTGVLLSGGRVTVFSQGAAPAELGHVRRQFEFGEFLREGMTPLFPVLHKHRSGVCTVGPPRHLSTAGL